MSGLLYDLLVVVVTVIAFVALIAFSISCEKL
jgi:hypothetical protein